MPPNHDPDPDDQDLSDQDIYAAMGELPGFIDITTSDFREVYRLAHQHAVGRLLAAVRAADLMQAQAAVLDPGLSLDLAVAEMASHDAKSAAVTDGDGRVVGMLSETDVLRRLGVRTCLGLLHRHLNDPQTVCAGCHETTVGEVMSQPAVCVPPEADYHALLRAFRAHRGRRMPVVDRDGRLLGLVARKDFLHAVHREVRA